MKQYRFILLSLSLIMVTAATAQQAWTLEQCIRHAIDNNLSIRLRQDNILQQEIALSTTQNSRLPNLSGSAGESFSFGRALTSDNTYANRNTQSTNFSLSTSVPIYTGGQISNEIHVRRLDLQAALQDCEKAREDVTLNVMSAYLEAIYQKDLVAVAERQLELSTMQANRLRVLYENQKASEADVAQARSAQAQDELSLTQQRNTYQLALLSLSQLLELPSPDDFDVVQPAKTDVASDVLPSPDAVYSEALGQKPQILAEEFRLKSAERSVRVAQSGYFPSLYFSGGLGSSYYKTSGYSTPTFSRQLKDNFNQYVGLSLSVPIFNRLSTRNNVRAARLKAHSQEIQLEETRKSLYKDIQQAYYNALAAQRQCSSSEVALVASQAAFELMQRKYENGKATATEYQEARTNLQKAEATDVQARYTYMFRRKILEFYRESRL